MSINMQRKTKYIRTSYLGTHLFHTFKLNIVQANLPLYQSLEIMHLPANILNLDNQKTNKILEYIRFQVCISILYTNYEFKQMSEKQVGCELKNNLPAQANIQYLKILASDKLKYFRTKRLAKSLFKSRQTSTKFKDYLDSHREMPVILLNASRVVQKIQVPVNRVMNTCFRRLKLSANTQQANTLQSSKDLNFGLRPNEPDHTRQIPIQRQLLLQSLNNLYKANLLPLVQGSFRGLKRSKNRLPIRNQPTNDEINYSKNNIQSLDKVRICQISEKVGENMLQQSNSLFLQASFTQSRYQRSEALSNFDQDYSAIKQLLEQKIDCLNLKFSQTTKRYQEAILSLQEQILMQRQVAYSRSQNLQGSQNTELESIMHQDSLFSSDIRQTSHTSDIASNLPKQSYSQLSNRHQQLHQEADHVGAIIEQVIAMSQLESDINPNLIFLLNQVKQILKPSPLGNSLIVT